MGTLPSSRQCRDEVSRRRAWGKSRLDMLLILPLLPTILLLLPHTAASPERASHAFTHLLSSQSPFLLFPNPDPRAQTNVRKMAKWTSASKKHFSQNRPGAHQPWTKREIGQLYNKPPQQWSKQGERPPYFLPIPKLASNSIDFLVRPLDGINSFQISPPNPLPLPSSQCPDGPIPHQGWAGRCQSLARRVNNVCEEKDLHNGIFGTWDHQDAFEGF